MLSDKSIIRTGKTSIYHRIAQKIHMKMSKAGRKKLNKTYVRGIKNKDFSIISSNCMGGALYHDIGMQFFSPTINMAFDGEDFCKLCENLTYYLGCEMTELHTDLVSHPVGKLDDVEALLVHYNSVDEAREKWRERAKRVNFDKILIMATDRDGMVDWMERFDRLPYKKIMFTAKPYPQYDWAVWCPCFEGQPCVGVMTGIADFQGHRFYEKYVDMLSVLNSL